MLSKVTHFQFFRSSRRVKMSFLYEKGRATFMLLCAYRIKKDNASLDFEHDENEICKKQRLLPFPLSSPGRQQVLRATSLAALKYLYKGTTTK